ncbi:MAG: RNA methyltransferase [Planctomycetota bacterium]
MIGRLTPIHDPQDPRVDAYRNQKDAWLRAGHNPGRDPEHSRTAGDGGCFMAEGSLVVEHLLASEYRTESVLVSEHRAETLQELLARVPEDVPIYVGKRAVLESIVGFDIHRGLLACGRRGLARDPMDVAGSSRALVVLEALSNHDNVGSVFRSAAALAGRGIGVLLSPDCCDPLYRKSLRVSMGHALRIPFATVPDWPGGLDQLRELGFDLLALDPGVDAQPIDRIDPPAKPALILGAEGPGLSEQIRTLIGQLIRIPQAQGVDSLNIAVAAAVALHRTVRPS